MVVYGPTASPTDALLVFLSGVRPGVLDWLDARASLLLFQGVVEAATVKVEP